MQNNKILYSTQIKLIFFFAANHTGAQNQSLLFQIVSIILSKKSVIERLSVL